MYESIR